MNVLISSASVSTNGTPPVPDSVSVRPLPLPGWEKHDFPTRAKKYPQLRFMGSKHRLLPWIHEVLVDLEFDTALDAFSGSASVAYLMKAMGKQVTANDFLRFSSTVAEATIENPGHRLSTSKVEGLLRRDSEHPDFIERTFSGIFYTPADLRFLDRVSWNIRRLDDRYDRAVAMAALIRSCVKRQPRGVFTVAGDPEHYKDGRRDLHLSLEEHFLEQIELYNDAAFDNGQSNRATNCDVFELERGEYDLVYLDPPYVPRADDNCYIKRYHFLEGLSCYWEGLDVLQDTRVKKIPKRFTPFSYRRCAADAFRSLFERFADSTLVLSYSSNGYPDLPILLELLKRVKRDVHVVERAHRYHFGTHKAVNRASTKEYLVVGI